MHDDQATTPSRAADEALAERFARCVTQFHQARPANLTLLVAIGSVELFVTVVDGRVTRLADRRTCAPLQASDIIVRASGEAWRKFWVRMPAPGDHDLFALMRNGHMTLEGNLRLLMVHLQYVKDLLAASRETTS